MIKEVRPFGLEDGDGGAAQDAREESEIWKDEAGAIGGSVGAIGAEAIGHFIAGGLVIIRDNALVLTDGRIAREAGHAGIFQKKAGHAVALPRTELAPRQCHDLGEPSRRLVRLRIGPGVAD